MRKKLNALSTYYNNMLGVYHAKTSEDDVEKVRDRGLFQCTFQLNLEHKDPEVFFSQLLWLLSNILIPSNHLTGCLNRDEELTSRLIPYLTF